MIKLSSLLEHILDHPMKGEAIQEAKRLESLETPRVNAFRTPLVDDEGDKVYIIVDDRGCYADWQLTGRDAENDAMHRTEDTGQPHTVCQVMAPVNGECPMIPVATFTPERPHEWVIYNANGRFESRLFAMSGCIKYWASELTNKEARRFATAAEAQSYINANDIQDAFPWAIPKLSEK